MAWSSARAGRHAGHRPARSGAESRQVALRLSPRSRGRPRPWLAARSAPSLRLHDSAAPAPWLPSKARAAALQRRLHFAPKWLFASAPIGPAEAVRVQYDFDARASPAQPMWRARDLRPRRAQDTSGSGPDVRAFQGMRGALSFATRAALCVVDAPRAASANSRAPPRAAAPRETKRVSSLCRGEHGCFADAQSFRGRLAHLVSEAESDTEVASKFASVAKHLLAASQAAQPRFQRRGRGAPRRRTCSAEGARGTPSAGSPPKFFDGPGASVPAGASRRRGARALWLAPLRIAQHGRRAAISLAR